MFRNVCMHNSIKRKGEEKKTRKNFYDQGKKRKTTLNENEKHKSFP